ncbi:MAG: hypothetical protein LBG11_08630, partial [Bifidobacteriaceae bacterium]|nr:hypothetical protein [Bifidobacteriaceae bacterium]
QGRIHLLGGESGLGQPPVVSDVKSSVRVGGVVSTTVLDHAIDPEGGALTLGRDLSCIGVNGETISASGSDTAAIGADGTELAFTAGKLVRYRAPNISGTAECVFTVFDPEGNSASAALTITIHQSSGDDKPPPSPAALTARVQVGQTVRIPVPLYGIDVDGDGVMLQGVASAPAKGRITAVGADFIDYEALPDEEGTDTFTYAVEDWVGLRATAEVKVGVAAGLATAGLLARDDSVNLRPGKRVGVPVLANDVQTGNEDLTLCGEPVTSEPTMAVEVTDNRLELTAPDAAGTYQVAYTACDPLGASGNANLTVAVEPGAPLEPPVVSDSVVKPEDTRNKASVQVRVLDRTSNPSGPISDLVVSLPGTPPEIASVTADGTVTVQLQEDRPLLLPFKVANTAEGPDGPYSYGFLSAPKLGTFPPSLRPRVQGIEVRAGVAQEIELEEIVQVGPGKSPLLADPEAITATKTDGTKPYREDGRALIYTARADYAGPASITFDVTDGKSAEDPTGRRSLLTLLLNVVGQDVRPPELRGATLQVAPGETATVIDLAKLTSVPGVPEPVGLTFTQTTATPKFFNVRLDGPNLSVSAQVGAPVGTSAQLTIRVAYLSTSSEGQLGVQVVSSRRPLLSLPKIAALRSKGEPVSADVLAGAANPVPEAGPPSLLGGAEGPEVTPAEAATVTVAGGTITVTPKGGYTGSGRVSYSANDALGEASRVVRGTFEFAVIGRPDPPGQPQAMGSVFDGQVPLQWLQPNSRNADIDHYLVEYPGGSQRCEASPCTVTGLPMGTSLAFIIKAHNEAGYSDPSRASLEVIVDVPPSSPPQVTATPADGGGEISWTAATGRGSAVTGYTVKLTGGVGAGTFAVGNKLNYSARGLQNGTEYKVTVEATNVSNQSVLSEPASFTPFGPPGPPSLSLSHSGDLARPLAINWSAGTANGSSHLTTTVTLRGPSGTNQTLVDSSREASGSLTVAADPAKAYTV